MATAADLSKLRKVVDRHRKERGDREAHMRNHLDFHQIINAISGNDEAIKILDRHNQIIFGLRRNVGFGPNRIDEIVADHEAIYDAIACHDEKAAEEAAERHASRAKEDMLKRMEDNGD
jgi:DNA-binding GntR family transcriptional regulator